MEESPRNQVRSEEAVLIDGEEDPLVARSDGEHTTLVALRRCWQPPDHVPPQRLDEPDLTGHGSRPRGALNPKRRLELRFES